jgi:hypothetical protein
MSLSSHILCGVISVHFPHLSVGTLATGQMAVHLTGEMLNSVAECTDRARMHLHIGMINYYAVSSPFEHSETEPIAILFSRRLSLPADYNQNMWRPQSG